MKKVCVFKVGTNLKHAGEIVDKVWSECDELRNEPDIPINTAQTNCSEIRFYLNNIMS